ncbi:MAG: tRNA (N(6)-L-threonylcarbamoyladenosine(37)-C(2))-methylthiotransferase MtaB [Dehalococcoidia bacterium]|nr:MAG: tRNA (N(6)-L-threonylcarbamoyladenosine(37)-C(2))-methylthiotransferase MtaB [Dehalococcoidia bacterium]
MPQQATVSVLTLGCKLNQADAESMARRLMAGGVRVVARPEEGADAFVINTCSVTHVADRKARHLTRLARRLSPSATIILTGCYAETVPDNAAQFTGADLVLGNAAKSEIPDLLLERLPAGREPAASCPTPVKGSLRTRAFVKIQEGCDELCAFCIVPRTRGRERSRTVEEVVRGVLARQREGVQEVVLTGTQLGNYGRDLGWVEQGPRRLLEALLERTQVPRIRLSSLQAQDISPQLLRLWRDPRLCPHFHLPLQSGSDTVLRRRRRRYTAEQFRRAVGRIRDHVPDAAVTTDVIAGFPGETDADFEATCSLCRQVGLAAIHAFPYSRRPGTAANLMPDQVPVPVHRRRLERLLALAEASATAFRRRYLGRVMPVLWEEQKRGWWQGLTPNYLRVYTRADDDLTNRLLPSRLLTLRDGGLRGEPEPVGAPTA